MKDKTLHMIGNAHIDPVWLWQWQEGFHEVLASFQSALDRMNEEEDFIFVSSSAAFYEWVEKSNPMMFAEIQKRVSEGRWEIVGGWWIQPDCNIPSGESFVRQGLYGQHYFKEKFGVTARVGYNVDSFGHHGNLPQILKKSGMDFYIFMRPGPHEKGLPSRLFWWEADDGSRVLTCRLPFTYANWGQSVEKQVVRCAAEMRDPVDEMVCFYGVGNHGGGPTRENLASIAQLQSDPEQPTLKHSSPNRFFDSVTAKAWPLPVIHDDLQHHASGCYAAHSGIKRWNRQAENRLQTAEIWSTIAHQVTGQPYPNALKQAWKNVLFNQFHDILAGTSLESAYEDAHHAHGEAMSIADRALNYAVQSLAWQINIEPEENMRPIIVFNPHAWETHVNVEVEFGRFHEEDILIDDQGNQVPVQPVQSEATVRRRHRLSFNATLPPLGYRVYRVLPRPDERLNRSSVSASDTVLENDRFRLEFNSETGNIKSLRDKKRGLEVFSDEAARPVMIADDSDTWSHNVYTFNEVVGEFKAVTVQLVAHGPVKSIIRVISVYGRSRLVQDFIMAPDSDRIEVRASVDWQEQFKMLKLRFPLHLHFMKATYEIPYGHIERFANGEENPGQRWLDLSGTSPDSGDRYGFSLLNDSKYSFDVNVGDIGLTVLRSPIYAHHIPTEPQPDEEYVFIDQGLQRFNYSLLPHDGSWEEAGTVRAAAELNQPPVALVGTFHAGPLPHTNSFIRVNQPNINVSIIKKAEDNDDLIVRAYETAETATDVCIHFPQWKRKIEAHFDPCELKTFRVPANKKKPVVEVNLLEWVEK